MQLDDYSYLITPDNIGRRLDSFLSTSLPEISRAAIQRAIQKGECLVNNQVAKASYKLRLDDQVNLAIFPPEPLSAIPENIPLTIVFEDDELIVVNKPAGMVIHPGAGAKSGTLANALVHHFNSLANKNSLRPGIVHRLDVGTSGLVVIAKTDSTLQNLNLQFSERRVAKNYITLVFGQVKNASGVIIFPIGRDPKNRVKMTVCPTGQGRYAETHFRLRQQFTDFTLLDIEIKTGRTHQIRVHLAHLNYPIVGDTTYDGGRGNTVKNTQLRVAIEKLGRPFLHAAHLSFTHPNGTQMSFSAPLPEPLNSFLSHLN